MVFPASPATCDGLNGPAPAKSSPTLANWSIFLAILPFSISAIEMQITRVNGMTAPISIALCSAFAALYAASIITAIVALCTRRGRKGVIVRSGLALLLAAAVLSIAVPGFFRGRANALARKAENESNAAILAREQASAHEQKQTSARELLGAMETAAGKMTGKDAISARIASQFIAQMVRASEMHEAAKKRLLNSEAFVPANLTTKDAIARWRGMLKESIAAGEKWFELDMSAAAYFQQAMQKERFTETEIRRFLDGWHRGRDLDPTMAKIKKARSGDLRGSRALLAIVTLLERELGTWQPDAGGKSAIMKNPAAQKEFGRLVGELQTVGKEQETLEIELKALQAARR